MKALHPTARLVVASVAAISLFTAACSDSDTDSGTETPGTGATAATTTAANPYEGTLNGAFEITGGTCTDGIAAGTYFRMLQPGGTLEAGPFIENPDSGCTDTTYTLLAFGPSEGALLTTSSQPAPDPAFDADGNGLADRIFAPVKFFGVSFAVATDSAPTITESNGVLTGDLSAFTAYYGSLVFNQGAPKPDGTGPAPTGTIEPVNGYYVLEWTSLISGGSFDGFTGVWHVEGRFHP